MTRTFNVTGSCDPQIHYMVDITGRYFRRTVINSWNPVFGLDNELIRKIVDEAETSRLRGL